MADVKHRIQIVVQVAYSSLNDLWRDNRLPISMKVKLYQAAVCSPFTNTCEAWDPTDSVLRTINGFKSQCLSALLFKLDMHEKVAYPSFD